MAARPAANLEMPKAWHLLVAICFGMQPARIRTRSCRGASSFYRDRLQLAQISQKRRAFGRRRRPVDMDAISRQDRSLRVVLNDEPEERVVKIEHLLQRRGAVVVEVRSRP